MVENVLSHQHFQCELVIGLVAPLGAEKDFVTNTLTETLELAGYNVVHIKISRDVIPTFVNVKSTGGDKYDYYREHMNAGNECRRLSQDCEILGKGAAFAISKNRADQGKAEQPMPKTAFIIDSLKRPEEVNVLRIIYSNGFVLVGIHEEVRRRHSHLTETHGIAAEQANELIQTDREETSEPDGQRVNDTFHLADCFVELTGNNDQLRTDVRRIVELCFGNPFLTPTFDELAMFQAFSSALRSADLSRQVGAVIARDNQILATGANDCPRAGGGLYWPYRDVESGKVVDVPNGKDYRRGDAGHDGYDSNRIEQLRMLSKLSERLCKELNVGKKGKKFTNDFFIELLDKEEIQGLTEYGRVVHAEMEAILSCARIGIATIDATLYSTTFPCHNCAKHIIASGIRRVVYVEPYSKSLALEFHNDSIATSGQTTHERSGKVVFEPFVGIGPRRFFDFFSMKLGASYDLARKVKKTGTRKDWSIASARLRLQMKPVSYLHLEELATQEFGCYVSNRESLKGGNS